MPLLKARPGKLEKIPPYGRVLLLLIPIFVSSWAIYQFLLAPKARKAEAMQGEISRVRMEIAAQRRLLAESKPLTEAEKREIERTRQRLDSMLGSLSTAGRIYNTLTSQALSCNINDISVDTTYSPKEKEDLPDKGALEVERTLGLERFRSYIRVNFHANLKDLGCFLGGINGWDNHILIESIKVKRELPKPAAELVLKVFTKESRE